MANINEFRIRFATDGLAIFPGPIVETLSLSKQDAEWLTEVGLPRSVAPFMSFGGKYEINLPTLAQLWDVADGAKYRIIGSNGSGDPIAIDTAKNGEIVYLNHDNNFQRVFINSSVVKLAETLVAYSQLIDETQIANGSDAYLDGNVPAEILECFISLVEHLDPLALANGMWADELAQLRERAEE